MVRDWPRFKGDVQDFFLPTIFYGLGAYVLKQCRTGQALETVLKIDHSIDKIWEQLEDSDRYRRISKITDAILQDIKAI